MSFKDTAKGKRLIILLLQDMEKATTEELISEAEILGIAECRDRVPSSLTDIFSDGVVKREISKEKKAIVWRLAKDIDIQELIKEP